MSTLKKTTLTLALAGVTLASTAHANEVEVLHWWTSGGEARAANVLKELMEAEGYGWQDFAVAGGGGETAMTVLKSRAMSGNPPSAAQIKGPEIQEWGELGLLGDLTALPTPKVGMNCCPKWWPMSCATTANTWRYLLTCTG